MERIVIFGSTGMTGLCAVEAAVQKGLNVRAFVRNPSLLPDHLRDSVEVVKGDVLDYKDVLNAIKGVTAVVVVLGTRNDLKATTVLSEGTKNIVQAMKELNVEIISICLSAFLFYEPEKVPPVFKEINSDHQRQMDIVKGSGLKFIIVNPPHIADMPGLEYTISQDTPGKSRVITKFALGKFLIDSILLPERYGHIYGICNKAQCA
ncbi:flavin reductase (NADPH) [Onthophagus taurus]|uniref:flavin reductase (NADPH) n=1 Tax=Onthophagus taurus TaxID=166361 RepID=UPI0039BDAE63